MYFFLLQQNILNNVQMYDSCINAVQFAVYEAYCVSK